MSSLHDSVVDVIATRFGLDRADITAEATFDDLGLDSLSQIELVTALRKRLGADIDDEEMAELSAVGEVVAALESKGLKAA
ncbi:acyl carrier protein [Streptomyces sioyaensis]|uniref:Acyl carrier protein n=1 Tax=Streptomyces sioyaensis TaxID=67364 RepID=A0A4Q1QQL5_9ACTN|nr:acyl carrier protein [Streptomyces sioyaensis]MBM4794456.1 acyl carrier protein [Streptomyces sioyaensis]RXS65287.1 acyl carrier protein [Streptomyces sioyaensis]